MQVKADELMSQMEEVAQRLAEMPDTEPLAKLIDDWVRCVEYLHNQAQVPDVLDTIHRAVSCANGFNPLVLR